METMENIWNKVASIDAREARSIIYKDENDLAYLYAQGFVDARNHTLEEWIEAFKDSRREDGSYRLSHSQWMAKKKYRPVSGTPVITASSFSASYDRLSNLTGHGKKGNLDAFSTTSHNTVSIRALRSVRTSPQSGRI